MKNWKYGDVELKEWEQRKDLTGCTFLVIFFLLVALGLTLAWWFQ